MEKTFMTLPEAAEFLGMSKSTIYQLTHTKAINFYKPNGGKIYFNIKDLNEFMKKGLIDAKGKKARRKQIPIPGLKVGMVIETTVGIYNIIDAGKSELIYANGTVWNLLSTIDVSFIKKIGVYHSHCFLSIPIMETTIMEIIWTREE